MNVFREIEDNTALPDIPDRVLPKRIYQGKSWKNISFGKHASIDIYKEKGLYLEVGVKPPSDLYHNNVLIEEQIDHTNKEVILVWNRVEKPPEQIMEIARTADIQEAIKAEGLRTYTIEQANTYINNQIAQITNIASAKTVLKRVFKKMMPYLLSE